MMLVQKPQPVSLSSPAPYTHRRHPSAPVVVRPTPTPGLLSVTKPAARPSPQRQAPSSQHRREPRSHSKQPKHGSAVVRAQPLTPAAEIKQPSPAPSAAPATPSPQSRGRSAAKHGKEKTQIQRSASQSSLRGKHGRQPSPPITTAATSTNTTQQAPSQAEAPTTVPPIKSFNLFDPFLDHSTSSPPPSPTLGSKPSGKLARRRQQMSQQQQQLANQPSKAIPVPKSSQRSKPSTLSRSEPALHAFGEFPVCDDSNSTADQEYASFPSTPRRPTHARSGAQTSPIHTRNGDAPFDFSFTHAPLSTPSAPAGGKRSSARKHRRVPSEGVFNMSSDEDVSSGPGGVVLNANVQALFGLVSGSGKRTSLPAATLFSTPVPARDAAHYSGSRESSPFYSSDASPSSSSESLQYDYEARKKAGYFASSMFQNSPSPEELPDPLNL
ncbi:hypothetical protein CVT26_009496 [Gymnopilus dilepis]|uniref:Uncharacterized protein n=1 Tax=Gymnopilus dilepis TaxID=231916 RepID=A0A409VJV6_9AGAR|nr:hypothetical protein CVT26_009496 [Gymnopilus dilepis]